MNIKVSFIPSKGPTVKNNNLLETINGGLENIDYTKLSPVYQSIKEVKKLIKIITNHGLVFLVRLGQ